MTNFKINIPDNAKVILDVLKKNGYEAFVVGGCTRDAILGLAPHDWDICTSATPDQMLECFKDFRVIETGLKHGTITVMVDVEPFEVTTYRIDGEYSDNRHPDEVIFVTDIKKDLSRRDITINAMAYNNEVGLVDFFNGYEDIQNKIIRCVGNPDDRFNEDALRIMRVLRFASTYGFTIDEKTDESLMKNKKLLHNIAVERINKELCRLLTGKGAEYILLNYKEIIGEIIPEIKPCFDFEQNNKHHIYDVYTHMIKALSYYKGDDFFVTLSLFLHDIGKPNVYFEDETGGHFHGHGSISHEIVKEILTRMRFDNETIKNVSELVLFHDSTVEPEKKHIRRWLNKIGEKQFRRLMDVRKCDVLAHSEINKEKNLKKVESILSVLDEVIEEESCFSIKDLAINGNDLIAAGIKQGPKTGEILNYLLEMVIDEKIKNEKSILLAEALKF